MRKRAAVLVIVVSALSGIAACGNADDARAGEVRTALAGNWRFDYQEEDARVRGVTNVDADGKFTESTERTQKDGAKKATEATGEWSFDGVNFKRMTMTLDGQKLQNRSFTYSALAVKSMTATGFTGVDNIAQREIRFERVAPGTRP